MTDNDTDPQTDETAPSSSAPADRSGLPTTRRTFLGGVVASSALQAAGTAAGSGGASAVSPQATTPSGYGEGGYGAGGYGGGSQSSGGLPTAPGEPTFQEVLQVIEAFNDGRQYNGVDVSFQDVLQVIEAFNAGN